MGFQRTRTSSRCAAAAVHECAGSAAKNAESTPEVSARTERAWMTKPQLGPEQVAVAHHKRLQEVAELIAAAFARAGAPLLDSDSLYLGRLSHWYQGAIYDDHLRFQDPTSRKLVEAVK